MRRTILVIWGLVLVALASCNYDTGECYPRGQDGAGAGGGIILQGGAGGFGDAPEKKPQDAANAADPCSAESFECLVTWENACDAQGTSCVPTSTTYRCTCASLDDAKKSCEKALGVGTPSGPLSCGPCKAATTADKTCTDMYEACQDKGMPCTRVIDAKKTLCAFCLSDCNAKQPYKYAECYQCGFE